MREKRKKLLTLAGMVAEDEEALACDFAETYGILSFRELPTGTAAVLAAGLREDSRIRMKLDGSSASATVTLLAAIADCMLLNVWMQTKDGRKGINKPKSVLKMMISQEESDEIESFESVEAFEHERARIREGR